MADADDVLNSLLENATQPAQVEGDMGKIVEHSLPDQIAALKFLKGEEAATSNRLFGIRIKRMVPPNAIGGPNDP